MQIFQHGGGEFRAVALRIQILIADDQLAAVLTGALRRDPERARMPYVQ